MVRFLSDLGRAGRSLRRHPGFAVFVVVTLALAVGANTAIFAVVRAVLLQPLPFDEPERLFRLWESNPSEGREFEDLSPANFLDWRAQTSAFEDLAFWRDTAVTLAGEREPVEITAERVSVNLFEVFGVRALLGRTFLPSEGREKVAVLSHDLWRSAYGADPGIIGRTVSIDREPYLVVGVMPPHFNLLGRPIAVWYPEQFEPDQFRRRHYLETVGRLQPGVSLERAQADLATVTARLAAEHSETNDGWGARLAPLREQLVGTARRPLLILLGASGCIVLVACANVAALLLARSTRREEELAIRAALGADRGRLLRQLLAESLLLAGVAGILGFLLVRFGLGLLLAAEPGDLPRVGEVSVGLTAVFYAGGLSLAAVAVFGLLPALRVSARHPGARLPAGRSMHGARGPRHGVALRLLTVTEIAVAVMLVTFGGLLLRSFVKLRQVDPGFVPDHVVVGRVTLDKTSYPEEPQTLAYFERLLERLRTLPGVQAAGVVTALPFQPVGIDFETPYWTPVGAPVSVEEEPQVAFRVVSPGYFEALGTPLAAGRNFDAGDREGAPQVVIVNRRMARDAWPGQVAIGQRLGFFSSEADEFEVVGVVADVHHYGFASEPRPELFVPQAQHPWYESFYVVVRTLPAPATMVEPIRRTVLAVDSGLPIANPTTMERLLAASVARDRFLTLLLAVMATLALFLAVTGIYAVISYSVSQRVHEIGVRMAVGARPVNVLARVLREGGSLALAGLVLGLAGARAAAELLHGFLFEVSAGDLATYATGAAVLFVTALVACWLPARRAARMDPIAALRS